MTELLKSPILSFLIILLIIVIIGFITYKQIKKKLDAFCAKHFSMNASTALNSFLRMYKEEQFVPKPVTEMTAVYRPKIQRDFPEGSYHNMESMARNSLIAAFNAIEAQDAAPLKQYGDGIYNQVLNTVNDLKSLGHKQFFDKLKINKIAIAYYKSDYDCHKAVARFEISLGCYNYTTNGNKVVSGSKDRMFQAVYAVELIYQQEYEEGRNTVYTNNCPNCGAPISAMGQNKECSYCGSGLTEVATRIWLAAGYKLIK